MAARPRRTVRPNRPDARPLLCVALLLLLAGCGGSSDGDTRPLRDTGGGAAGTDVRDVGPGAPDDVPRAAETTADQPGADVPPDQCEGLLVPPNGYECQNPPATPPHVVDGRFTGWAPGCPLSVHEWTCKPRSSGWGAHAYFDYVDGHLHVMNDWSLNVEGPLDPTCACSFRGYSADGLVTWDVLVFGDQSVTERRSGAPVEPADAPGATDFGRSPLTAGRDHTMCEVALPTARGAFGLALRAPRGSAPCEPGAPCDSGGSGGAPAPEELYVSGVITEDGVADLVVDALPALLAIVPPEGRVGDIVTFVGLGFGEAVGVVSFNGRTAELVSWADRVIQARVPPETRSGPARVRAGSRWSNALWFGIVCVPDCEGRLCGGDGCGGSCGECGEREWCAGDGVCTCLPDCAPWYCGPDGCGGVCACGEPDFVCDVEFNCRVDCEPECAGRVCGRDGCGRECGAGCQEGWGCNAGVCVRDCAHFCAGRECGDDGCGGSCGECVGERAECMGGACTCEPYCVNRVCGIDGCGGTCGTCAPGLTCVSGACECIPQCAGRTCGDDGCGGSCGTCAGGRIQCVEGRCRCVPDCDGRECGDDGCSLSCGSCPLGEECGPEGLCVPCQPDCAGRVCGPDGCEGSCGSCAGTQEVCRDGQCVCEPSCGGRECGGDGCGGLCGTCPDGQECDKDGRCAVPQ